MGKKIVNKSVSFNVIDPFQRQMKDYADQYPNFSAYIKRLIQRDMEEGTKVKSIKKAPSRVVSNLKMTQLEGIKL